MDTRRRTLVLAPMLHRAPKQAPASPPWGLRERVVPKAERTSSTDVFTFTPDKVSSKEKVKYVMSRTVNRKMLVVVDLFKELQSNNSIAGISNSDLNSLIIKPLDTFLDGRVIKKPHDIPNPFDAPRSVTTSFTKLMSILK